MKDDKRHTEPNQAGSREEKRKVSGDVHVGGKVEVDFAKTLVDEYVSTRKEDTDKEHKHYRLAIITLIVGITYAGLTAWLAISSQISASAARKAVSQSHMQFIQDQRPYVWEKSETTSAPVFRTEPNDPNMGQIVWAWHMTNYGKTPANKITFTQEMKTAGGTWTPCYGENGKDVGGPQAPGGDAFDSVVSAPMTAAEYNRLLAITDGISVRIKIWYVGVEGTTVYESGICLSRTNFGSIAYCRTDNYIR